jgi:hypothetical protein
MSDDCPFSVGQTVFYRPDARIRGLTANDRPDETPSFGSAVRISAIEKGAYVVCEGYRHPGGGMHWTAFSAD